MRVVVVGAGINGLLTTRELAQANVEIILCDQGEFAQQASWAGGGIVSPLYPWRYAPAITVLSRWAQAAYPALRDELLATVGTDIELLQSGLLFVNPDDARDARVWAQANNTVCEVLDASALRQRWPGLAHDAEHGVFLPEIAQVRNPRLLKALVADLQRHQQVQLRPHTAVVKIKGGQGAGPASVTLASGEVIEADAVIVCAGAWSAKLLPQAVVPVRPVRGQMLQYETAPGTIKSMILRDGHYLIPRQDGLVLCGSTLEETGFDGRTTAEARELLENVAVTLWPGLTMLPPVRHWAGLRPGSPNGIPFIGALPEQSRVWVNAGQYRNGLVLAPASAALISDLVLGLTPRLAAEPYAPMACA
jgi:glycine oxidase